MLKQQIELMNSEEYEPEVHLCMCGIMIDHWLEWSAAEVTNVGTDGEAIRAAHDMKEFHTFSTFLKRIMITYPSEFSAEYITTRVKELNAELHKFNHIDQTTLKKYVMSKPIQSILKDMGHEISVSEVRGFPI